MIESLSLFLIKLIKTKADDKKRSKKSNKRKKMN